MSLSPRDLNTGKGADANGRVRSISSPSAPITISSPLPEGRKLSTGNSVGSILAPVVEFHTSFDFEEDKADAHSRRPTPKLVSPADAKLAHQLQTFMDDADAMLNRVESRRKGYNNFKQLKKQASAVKHTIRNVIFGKKRTCLSVSVLVYVCLRPLTLPPTSYHLLLAGTKLDELKELADSLLQQYDRMSAVFMERTVVALEVQQALLEQSREYQSRLNSCMEHNKQKAKRVHTEWKNTFSYVCDLDDEIKSFTQAVLFQDEVSALKSRDARSSFSGAYIPWAMRAEMGEEEEAAKAEEEAQKKLQEEARNAAEAIAKEEYLRRIGILVEARTASRAFMDKLMKQREAVEDTLKRLQDTSKYLKSIREELVQEQERGNRMTEIVAPELCASMASSLDDGIPANSPTSSSRSKEWDHKDCADCNVVHGIARGCGDHLVASYYKAEENAKQLNELLVRGDALRSAKEEIRTNFTAWGDLPQSYSGGVY